ncbi:MAG: HupE/UreJ family protein [Synechococcus sp.]
MAGLTVALAASPALAHHPFAMPEGGQMSLGQGLISGIGHPLLGPDHLLFLVALALVGWRQPRSWMVLLLAVGLFGSGIAQLVPLAESLTPWAEAAVSLTLVLEGLVILERLPAISLLPAIALHGYLLGGTIVGAESTPLLGYGLGLVLSQGAVLLLAATISRGLQSWIGEHNRQLLAAVWIGIGSAFAWSILIP